MENFLLLLTLSKAIGRDSFSMGATTDDEEELDVVVDDEATFDEAEMFDVKDTKEAEADGR